MRLFYSTDLYGSMYPPPHALLLGLLHALTSFPTLRPFSALRPCPPVFPSPLARHPRDAFAPYAKGRDFSGYTPCAPPSEMSVNPDSLRRPALPDQTARRPSSC